MQSISCYNEEQFTHPNWVALKQQADFIIITNPEVPKSF